MIGIDGSEAADGSDWFCYHSTSPSIFPSGFCEINHIELTPPRGTASCWDHARNNRNVQSGRELEHCVRVCACVCVSGYTNLPFRWFEYLKETRSVAAPVSLFNKVSPCGASARPHGLNRTLFWVT